MVPGDTARLNFPTLAGVPWVLDPVYFRREPQASEVNRRECQTQNKELPRSPTAEKAAQVMVPGGATRK